MTATYIWLAIYGVACVVFFVVSAWVIVRGGKDVLEMLTEQKNPEP